MVLEPCFFRKVCAAMTHDVAADFLAPPSDVATLTRSDDNAAFVHGLCDVAKEQDVWISVGVHESPQPEEEPTRCYNTHLLINQQGVICERYRKLHLYDVDIQNGPTILESNTTIPGESLKAPVSTSFGKLGVRDSWTYLAASHLL